MKEKKDEQRWAVIEGRWMPRYAGPAWFNPSLARIFHTEAAATAYLERSYKEKKEDWYIVPLVEGEP